MTRPTEQMPDDKIQEAKEMLQAIWDQFKSQEDVAEFLGSNRQLIWSLQSKDFCTHTTYEKIKDAKRKVDSDMFQKIKARHKRKLRAYDVIGLI